jgi:antitoxin ParD1/3/4
MPIVWAQWVSPPVWKAIPYLASAFPEVKNQGIPEWLTRWIEMLEWSEEVTIIPNFSYTMSRHTSTMTISLPKHLKEFVKERSLTAHYGTPSDYIRGLIREDLKRLEQEQLEQEMLKGLRSGKGIPMTTEAWKRLKAEAAKGVISPTARI